LPPLGGEWESMEDTSQAADRRAFLRRGGIVALGAPVALGLAACGGGNDTAATKAKSTATPKAAAGEGGGDIAIVNYALTLEYLEDDFYDQVVASGVLKGRALEYAKQFGSNEQEHVDALTATVQQLGGKPATRPKTKFKVESADQVLTLAATVENLGASAYLGQAGNIEDEQVLAAALAIHSVEARHAAALNELLGKSPTPDGAVSKPASMEEVLAAVKPFIVS
jgi:Ferritin-like domain